MRKSLHSIIADLQRDKRFMGTCPVCREDFRFADAALFAINDVPPSTALLAIQAKREQIKQQKTDLAKARERMTKRAEKTALSVNLGKIVEKIVPSFASFSYSAGDCRALFEPIDYLIFSGLTDRAAVESIIFVDVKSGKARLNDTQKSIKERVAGGAVRFDTIRS